MTNSYIAPRLIDWQKKSGRHDLPWQKSNDPYVVWISEVMLQQTQVSTVIPFFNKFIDSFPNINKLAEASEDEVMEHWSGLGYYRRAKFIMQSATILVKKYNATFPMTVDELKSLPGIGKSTAGAICALAFKKPAPILDANVKRVFCRFYGIKEWSGETRIDKKLWDLAEQNLPDKEVSIYTQALMDMGATLCKPKVPLCLKCPINKKCISYENNWVNEIPAKKIKKPKPIRVKHVLILENKNQILLEKKISPGVWQGLWSLPEIKKGFNEVNWVQHFLGISSFKTLNEGTISAIFSHYKLNLIFKHLSVNDLSDKPIKDTLKWFEKTQLSDASLPAPIKRLLINI